MQVSSSVTLTCSFVAYAYGLGQLASVGSRRMHSTTSVLILASAAPCSRYQLRLLSLLQNLWRLFLLLPPQQWPNSAQLRARSPFPPAFLQEAKVVAESQCWLLGRHGSERVLSSQTAGVLTLSSATLPGSDLLDLKLTAYQRRMKPCHVGGRGPLLLFQV